MCAEEEDDVDAFDFFTAEPIGSAARDLEKQLEAEVAEGVAPVLAEAPVEGVAPVEDMALVEAAAPVKSVAPVEAAEPVEAMASAKAEVPVEAEAPLEAVAPAAILEPEPMEMEEEEDAFDFFTAEPIGSAARELEKMQEAAAAEEALAEAMDTSD